MTRLSALRSFALLVLLSLLSLSFLPTTAAYYCNNCYNEYCSCGSCECDSYGNPYCGGCGLSGGGIAGIVIAVFFAIAICLCLMSLCYRRRYYQGGVYGTNRGQVLPPVVVSTGYASNVPMGAVPVGGYSTGQQQPMQAIPVQYSQYPQQQQPQYGQPANYAQPNNQQYGAPTYAQQPVGGGHPIGMYPPESDLPAYTPQDPSAPGADTNAQPEGFQQPYKPGRYDGEKAL